MKRKESISPIITGYYPGAIGMITELHATYYHEHWGFDISFEAQVGRELSVFMESFNTKKDGLWICTIDGSFAGSVAVDGKMPDEGEARLRWFIVRPEHQERGIGRTLLEKAIAFGRSTGYRKLSLWTFRGLDTARRIYESEGFRLSLEHEAGQWGSRIVEQKFELGLR